LRAASRARAEVRHFCTIALPARGFSPRKSAEESETASVESAGTAKKSKKVAKKKPVKKKVVATKKATSGKQSVGTAAEPTRPAETVSVMKPEVSAAEPSPAVVEPPAAKQDVVEFQADVAVVSEKDAVHSASSSDTAAEPAESAVEQKITRVEEEKIDNRFSEELSQPRVTEEVEPAAVSEMKPVAVSQTQVSTQEYVEIQVQRIVVFELGDISFGTDVFSVLTIIKMLPICPVPHLPEYLSGLINLRGQIIPVLDLGKRLGFEERPETDEMRIVVVEREKRLFGLIVDAVSAVEEIPLDRIRPPSQLMSSVKQEYLKGIADMETKLVLLLDLHQLLSK